MKRPKDSRPVSTFEVRATRYRFERPGIYWMENVLKELFCRKCDCLFGIEHTPNRIPVKARCRCSESAIAAIPKGAWRGKSDPRQAEFPFNQLLTKPIL